MPTPRAQSRTAPRAASRVTALVRPRAAQAASPRHADNRKQEVLATAARLFARHGYEATSMRDIAGEVGMLAGSLYYHFRSKEELVAATHGLGVRQIIDAVGAAIAGLRDPWQRLEAACVAQLECLLDASDFAAVVRQEFSRVSPALRRRLVAQRDEYEKLFAGLVEALPLGRAVDRRLLRLMLLGALNSTPVWYRPGGASPAAIARSYVALLRRRFSARRCRRR